MLIPANIIAIAIIFFISFLAAMTNFNRHSHFWQALERLFFRCYFAIDHLSLTGKDNPRRIFFRNFADYYWKQSNTFFRFVMSLKLMTPQKRPKKESRADSP